MTTPTSEWMTRYSRQIILPEIGGIGQKKLNESAVGLVGAGSMGWSFFLYGVGAGIGRWGILDRQENRAMAMVRAAKQRDRHVEVEVFPAWQFIDDLESWVGQWSLVVDTGNEPMLQQQLAKACQGMGVFFLTAWSSGANGWLLQSPCPFCLAATPAAVAPKAVSALDEMVLGLLGTVLAQQVIQALISVSDESQPAPLISFNGENGTFSSQKVSKSPDCPTCKD
jgi:molybdopterin-synthase adenylyltransferase